MTDAQKIEIYRIIRDRIKPSNKLGICQLIRRYCQNNGIEISVILINDFPELKLFAPGYWVNGFWFRLDPAGNQKRVEKLDNIIKYLEFKPVEHCS